MKPLSICICYCASLIACFKAVKVFDTWGGAGVCMAIVVSAWLAIGEIQKATEPTKEK